MPAALILPDRKIIIASELHISGILINRLALSEKFFIMASGKSGETDLGMCYGNFYGSQMRLAS